MYMHIWILEKKKKKKKSLHIGGMQQKGYDTTVTSWPGRVPRFDRFDATQKRGAARRGGHDGDIAEDNRATRRSFPSDSLFSSQSFPRVSLSLSLSPIIACKYNKLGLIVFRSVDRRKIASCNLEGIRRLVPHPFLCFLCPNGISTRDFLS